MLVALSAAQGMGFIVGPALGSALSAISITVHIFGTTYLIDANTAPGWLSAFLCFLNVLAFIWFHDTPLDVRFVGGVWGWGLYVISFVGRSGIER